MTQYIYFFKLNYVYQHLAEGMLEAYVSQLSKHTNYPNLYLFSSDRHIELKPLIQDMMSETLSDIFAYVSIPIKEKEVESHLIQLKHIMLTYEGIQKGLITNHDLLRFMKKPTLDLKKFIFQKYASKPFMLETVKSYLEYNQHAQHASKALYIHRNTLMMRLDNFYDATGFDVRTFIDGHFIYLLL